MSLIPYTSDNGAMDLIGGILGAANSFDDIERSGILFHGTGEPLSGPLHVSDVDGLFWTARTPAVAQAYIPHSGLTTYVAIDGYNLRQRVSPARDDALSRWAMSQAGVSIEELDLDLDAGGVLRSWCIPQGWPTWEDARLHLEELGYAPGRNGLYEVSLSFSNGIEEIKPADWRLPGHLVILYVPDLKIISLGGEGDLTDPQHRWQTQFDRAARTGADALEIGDFLQSRRWGNIGHRAIGLLPRALVHARYVALPATNHEFGSLLDFSRPETPAFVEACRTLSGVCLEPEDFAS